MYGSEYWPIFSQTQWKIKAMQLLRIPWGVNMTKCSIDLKIRNREIKFWHRMKNKEELGDFDTQTSYLSQKGQAETGCNLSEEIV